MIFPLIRLVALCRPRSLATARSERNVAAEDHRFCLFGGFDHADRARALGRCGVMHDARVRRRFSPRLATAAAMSLRPPPETAAAPAGPSTTRLLRSMSPSSCAGE